MQVFGRNWSANLGQTWPTKPPHAPPSDVFRPKIAVFVLFCPQTSHLARITSFSHVSGHVQENRKFQIFDQLGFQGGAKRGLSSEDRSAKADPASDGKNLIPCAGRRPPHSNIGTGVPAPGFAEPRNPEPTTLYGGVRGGFLGG